LRGSGGDASTRERSKKNRRAGEIPIGANGKGRYRNKKEGVRNSPMGLKKQLSQKAETKKLKENWRGKKAEAGEQGERWGKKGRKGQEKTAAKTPTGKRSGGEKFTETRVPHTNPEQKI